MSAFNKSAELFPIKKRFCFLNHCGVASVYMPAAEAQADQAQLLAEFGSTRIGDYTKTLSAFRSAAARLLGTEDSNISFIQNSAQGLNQIAYGFTFKPGDEVISYRYEYPSNHYPWKIQAQRGVTLKLIEGTLFDERPLNFSLEEVERLMSPRTKIVALSHVQFTSGFGVDLQALGALCRSRGIRLVIDAAQSLGCMPVEPEKLGIDALVSSGWKWLLGPVGSGVLYTSADFRAELKEVFVGPEMMTQGADYLNHSFSPHKDGRRFEYSTLPITVVRGLSESLKHFDRYGMEAVWKEIQLGQQTLIDALGSSVLRPAPLNAEERGGILSYVVGEGSADETTKAAEEFARRLLKEGVVCSVRGGYLRLAPHFYHEREELDRAGKIIGRVSSAL